MQWELLRNQKYSPISASCASNQSRTWKNFGVWFTFVFACVCDFHWLDERQLHLLLFIRLLFHQRLTEQRISQEVITKQFASRNDTKYFFKIRTAIIYRVGRRLSFGFAVFYPLSVWLPKFATFHGWANHKISGPSLSVLFMQGTANERAAGTRAGYVKDGPGIPASSVTGTSFASCLVIGKV